MNNHDLTRNGASWWLDILFLLCVIGSLYFIFLGTRPLFVPDEGRYAEIAREMTVTNDYLTPYLNSIKYFEKPALFYWLEAIAIKAFGLNLWSVRSVNALLGMLGCLFTYVTARKLYDRRTGLLAAFILGTSSLYFVMSHMITLDLPITVFLMASLFAFLLGCQASVTHHSRYYFWTAAFFAGLAVLTKGLIGIVFPLLIIGLWIAYLGNWRLIKQVHLLSSLFIFLLVVLPWHVLVGIKNPEFYYFYFIEQHFLRYTTLNIGHYQPAWFFIPVLMLGFFPWITFLPAALITSFSWKRRTSHQADLFFLIWATFIFVFFSFSKSKLIPYILPLFPPLAILTARYLIQGMQGQYRLGMKIAYALLFIISVIIAYQLYLFTHHSNLPNVVLAKMDCYIATAVLLLGATLGLIYSHFNIKRAIQVTIVTSGLFLLIILAAVPAIDTRTILPLATILKPLLQTNEDVITFNQYYQDLPFYLERRVTILNWRNELSYGMEHQNTREWMIDDQAFWQRFGGHRRVFFLISLKEFDLLQSKHPDKRFYLLGKTTTTALVSNRPNP